MRVGLDFSGVVINSDAAKIVTARRFLGVELHPDNTLYTAAGTPISPEMRASLLSLLFCTSQLLSAPPIPGAVEYISKLQSRGAKITVISNINHAGVPFAKQWLRMHGIRDVEFVSVGIGMPKSAWLEHHFDVFVDDKLSGLTNIEGVVPRRILFSHPYNAAVVLPVGIERANGWRQAYEYALRASD